VRDKNKSLEQLWQELVWPAVKDEAIVEKITIVTNSIGEDPLYPIRTLMEEIKTNSSTAQQVYHIGFQSSWFSRCCAIEDLFLKEPPNPTEKSTVIVFNAKKVNKNLIQQGYLAQNKPSSDSKTKVTDPEQNPALIIARRVKGWITRQKHKNKQAQFPKDKFSLANSIRKFCVTSRMVDVPLIIKFLFESQFITRCNTCNGWRYEKLLSREDTSNSKEEEDDITYCLNRLQRWIKNSPSSTKLPNSVPQLVSQIASFRRIESVSVAAVIEKLIEIKIISLGDESNNYLLKYF